MSRSPAPCAAAGLLVALSLGCAAPEPPLRVGMHGWIGYEPLFLARDVGGLEEGAVRLIRFPSAREAMRAYRHHALDVVALTADEALLVAEELPGQRIVLVCDVSRGGDAILAREGASSMLDLKGRRIGLMPHAVGAYVLSRALELSGMSAADVEPVQVALGEHEAALLGGRVDAIVTFEPVRSRLLRAKARVVFDTTRIPGEVVDVLLASPEAVARASGSLQALVEAWFEALRRIEEEPDLAARLLAPRVGMTGEQLLASLEGLEFPDRRANARMLAGAGAGLAPTLARLRDVMAKNRLLERPERAVLRLEDRFVREEGR